MGVSDLWSLLKSVGNVQYLSASEGTHTAVVQEVQARAVAVDLSAWVVQAICQPELAQAFNDPDSQALSVSFNRAVNHLRYECVPVAITEGRSPAEKLERLQQRFKARTGQSGGGTGNQYFARMGTAVANMLHSLGLPVVQAPGEGEAMCAALNEAGLVHACATCDGDVLLFGAHTTFHTLKLQSGDPQNSEIAKVELAWVQQMLGIQSGGADALIALSLLSGGDYAVKGAEHVGARSAVRLVQHLLQDCQDDGQVLDQLMNLACQPPDPAMEALSAQGCTGCKQCKHPGNRKGSIAKHSKRNPCSCCPPGYVAEHQTCQPHPEMPCQCDFHTKEPLRLIDKAVRRIQATADFSRKAADAAAAYHRQRQQATAAVVLVRRRYSMPAGQAFQWMHRPDAQQAAQHLSFWSEEVVRGKLLPVLMQWDMCHPDAAECEWVAQAINKVHVQKAAREEDCWRYIMHWHRLPHVNPELVEADNAWLKRSETHHRAIKMSLVQQHCPGLIRQFEQQQRGKVEKKTQAGRKQAASKAARGTAAITSFYSQQKKPASTPAPPTQPNPDMPEPLWTVRPPRGLSAAMVGGSNLGGAQAGWSGGRQGPVGAALMPQLKQATIPCKGASQSGNGPQQSAFQRSSAALSQSQSDRDPRSQRCTGHTEGQAATSSADVLSPLISDSSSNYELGLQSPYAMRLGQQQGGSSAQLRQAHSSSSGLVDTEPNANTWRQPDPCSRAEPASSSPRAQGHQEEPAASSPRAQGHQDEPAGSSPRAQGHLGRPAGSSPRAQPCQDEPAAAQRHQHRAGAGLLEIGSSLGHHPNSPDMVTPKSCVFTSPKRSMGSHEEEPITILSDSQSQEDLEISLSPSPAKRRKTPPTSPHPRSLCADMGIPDDEHRLSPAPSTGPPREAEPSVVQGRGLTLLKRIEGAATGTVSQLGTDGSGEEVEVVNCICPESVHDSGSQPQTVQDGELHSPAGSLLRHVQHSKAAGDNWRSKLVDSFEATPEEEDEKTSVQSGAGGSPAHARQQPAAVLCRSDQSATGSELEQLETRPRQVSRRGRGRGRGRAVQEKPLDRKPGMPVTLDSDRFGFVKLPSLRYADLTGCRCIGCSL
ncbi:hypothetical protein ABBQ32_004509 [Trebouxia sp. C0010 RCD-2024]